MKAMMLSALLLLAEPAAAQTAVDGDTIKMDGRLYDLHGIDAPEMAQTCIDGWPAGFEARKALTELMRGHTVTCEAPIIDLEGKPVATCKADDTDLSSAMVLAGEAFAFTARSAKYVAEEAEANAAARGIHAHNCTLPWDWRARIRGDR